MAKENGKALQDEPLELEEHPDDQDSPQSQGVGDVRAGAPTDQLKRLQDERDAVLDRLARLQAEFENYRKRSAKEQESFRDFAISDMVRTLLPVIDNFDLALKTQGDVRKGVELIRRQLDDVLAKLGVKPVESVGQRFDPHQHEAIEMVPTDDVEDHQVIDELQRGYKLRDKLVRPAMVRVAENNKSHKK